MAAILASQTDAQVALMKAEVEQLKMENARLKGGRRRRPSEDQGGKEENGLGS